MQRNLYIDYIQDALTELKKKNSFKMFPRGRLFPKNIKFNIINGQNGIQKSINTYLLVSDNPLIESHSIKVRKK